MPVQLDRPTIRQHLRDFNFKGLFNELGWDNHTEELNIQVGETNYPLTAIAHKRGFVVFVCESGSIGRSRSDGHGSLLDNTTRRKIERIVDKTHREHLIIFVDADSRIQKWQWVKREIGKPAACREHTFNRGQDGEALLQKLRYLAISLDEEESTTLPDVTGRVRAGFDVEPVVERFYKEFIKRLDVFLRFIKGIPEENLQRWYALIMLCRLMFIYFVQGKNFLDNDCMYLRHKFEQYGGKDCYYQEFLCYLFFDGFAQKEHLRTEKMKKLLGWVPYLNGGLFLKHDIEKKYNGCIQIADSAFADIFEFFDKWDWHLDNRPLKNDKEINPDVLGYIFEKLINQKQMGAYYTKEDITEYIGKNTIIPFLFDATEKQCPSAFQSETSVWQLLQEDPDRYIYDAIKHGIAVNIHENPPIALDEPLLLPAEIAVGIQSVEQRTEWNKPAPAQFALPTEIWREVVARRQRYEEVSSKLRNGEIRSINDLITYNLNIRQFAQDVIANCEIPDLLLAFYRAIEKITVLDPTCGSGAFLFAALNILEPLYDACLERMECLRNSPRVVEKQRLTTRGELNASGRNGQHEPFVAFRNILDRAAAHPNRKYFIIKAIIVNNLYGVDIMEEAVEICKLRLFLKLIAQVDSIEEIEPLPDIDFNIRPGNTLVGFATYEEVNRWITTELKTNQYKLRQILSGNALERIEAKAQKVDAQFVRFRQQQTEIDTNATHDEKRGLQTGLDELRNELNLYLAIEYGIDAINESAFARWQGSHKPFHWFVEFYGIMRSGGFDVIIGNPPYVEYETVTDLYRIKSFSTLPTGNLYSFMIERSDRLLCTDARFGMIVPSSASCTDGYMPLQELLKKHRILHISSYSDQRGKLFALPHPRLCIITYQNNHSQGKIFTTSYNKIGGSELRDFLFYRTKYLNVSGYNRPGIIPRYESEVEHLIHSKLFRQLRNVGYYTRRRGRYLVYYTRKISWYMQVTTFVPRIIDNRGKKRLPSELKTLKFDAQDYAEMIFALLNSNLFHWFVIVGSDCRNLNMREVLGFPIELETIPEATRCQLIKLSERLAIDFQEKSEFREMNFGSKTGKLNIQCLFPVKSKPIIDEIDRVLAQHYGFTDEELDFIINYDIKYRMRRKE